MLSGNCAVSDGWSFCEFYAVVAGVDKILPVDVYIPGCPPRPEALIHGMLQLKEKVNNPAKVRLRKI